MAPGEHPEAALVSTGCATPRGTDEPRHHPDKGYAPFLELMLGTFAQVVSTVQATHGREVNTAMVNDLFGIAGPRQVDRPVTDKELAWWEIWYNFMEIQGSYDALMDFDVYIRRYPYGGTRVARVRHLLYVIEAYLHEVYVLTERLKAFPGLVAKLLSGDPRQPIARDVAKTLAKAVNKSFKGLTAARGHHTHRERFDSDEFHRLRVMEGLLLAPKGVAWIEDVKLMFNSSYRDIRNRWTRTISDNNAKTRNFLDQYCDALRPLVFEDGKLNHAFASRRAQKRRAAERERLGRIDA